MEVFFVKICVMSANPLRDLLDLMEKIREDSAPNHYKALEYLVDGQEVFETHSLMNQLLHESIGVAQRLGMYEETKDLFESLWDQINAPGKIWTNTRAGGLTHVEWNFARTTAKSFDLASHALPP